MRLPGRLSAAIEVLADIEARHRPVAEALKAWGLNNRFAGAGDRAAIGNIVYDALRKRASHGWAMGAETPRALVLAWLFVALRYAHAAVHVSTNRVYRRFAVFTAGLVVLGLLWVWLVLRLILS